MVGRELLPGDTPDVIASNLASADEPVNNAPADAFSGRMGFAFVRAHR